MISVLHVFKTYRTETAGGVEETMRQIGYGCLPYGVKTTILTLSKNPHPPIVYDGEIEVLRYPINVTFASTGFSWKGFFAFREIAKKADIIHYHFPCPTNDLMEFIFRPDKPFIITYHSDIVRQKLLLHFYSPLMNWFLKRAAKIVVSSPNYAQSSKFISPYKEKISVIPFGLDEKMQTSSHPKLIETLNQRIGHSKFFFFVGMLRYYKGLHFLLQANSGIDYPIVIAGKGDKEKELKQQAQELGLKNVIFLGEISEEEKDALMDMCHVFVFPSHLRSEAFGISLLEAAMHKKPMISTEIGTGTSYINLHNETGLTVVPADPKALRAAMDELWNNPEKVRYMGQAARKRFDESFTSDKMAKSYAELYRSLFVSR